MGLFSFDEKYPFFDVTPVDNLFIQQFLPDTAGKAEYVRVYLYGLMHTYHGRDDMTLASFARDLKITETEVESAFLYWERRGLVQKISSKPPSYRYVSVKQAFMNGKPQIDTYFEEFVIELNNLFGTDRRLHGGETALVMEWVEKLNLPMDAVIALIKHLIVTKGKHFSFQAADKTAVELAEANVTSAEDAEFLLARKKATYDGAKKVLRRMGKRREPSEDETALFAEWLRLGYAVDAILEACRETTKGDPTFAYLDGILRGIFNRSDGSALPGTRQGMEKALDDMKKNGEPLRALYRVLGLRGAPVTDGTLALYGEMAKIASHDIILLAAAECARGGGKLNDVLDMLISWQKKGMDTPEKVKAYVVVFNQRGQFLRDMYTLWGIKTRPTASDRAALQRWIEEYGFDEERIGLAAPYAEHTERPIAYLEAILKSLHEKGIKTKDLMLRELSAAKKRPPSKGKTVSHQDYDQRSYEGDDLTETLKRLEKEGRLDT